MLVKIKNKLNKLIVFLTIINLPMSFFSLSQKNIDPALKNVPKVGPGAYDLNSPIKKI